MIPNNDVKAHPGASAAENYSHNDAHGLPDHLRHPSGNYFHVQKVADRVYVSHHYSGKRAQCVIRHGVTPTQAMWAATARLCNTLQLTQFEQSQATSCKSCGDTGSIMTGRSGEASDGNAPVIERCEDCEPHCIVNTININHTEFGADVTRMAKPIDARAVAEAVDAAQIEAQYSPMEVATLLVKANRREAELQATIAKSDEITQDQQSYLEGVASDMERLKYLLRQMFTANEVAEPQQWIGSPLQDEVARELGAWAKRPTEPEPVRASSLIEPKPVAWGQAECPPIPQVSMSHPARELLDVEDRYIVVKLKHYTDKKMNKVRSYLERKGVTTVNCLVCEPHWPMYKNVAALILKR